MFTLLYRAMTIHCFRLIKELFCHATKQAGRSVSSRTWHVCWCVRLQQDHFQKYFSLNCHVSICNKITFRNAVPWTVLCPYATRSLSEMWSRVVHVDLIYFKLLPQTTTKETDVHIMGFLSETKCNSTTKEKKWKNTFFPLDLKWPVVQQSKEDKKVKIDRGFNCNCIYMCCV